MATIKQKLVASKLLENPGKSVSQAMREAGYKESSAKNPQDLTRSMGWQELIDKYMSEEKLLNIHKRLLDSVKLGNLSFGLDTSDDDIRKAISKVKWARFVAVHKGEKSKICIYTMPDYRTQLNALEMAYKIKGRYQIDTEEQSKNVALQVALDRINRILPDADL
jgi:hypothetical protein